MQACSMCQASLRHISGVERILPEGQNTLVFWLSGRRASSTSPLQILKKIFTGFQIKSKKPKDYSRRSKTAARCCDISLFKGLAGR
jgi:hypothetical protein